MPHHNNSNNELRLSLAKTLIEKKFIKNFVNRKMICKEL